MKTDTLPDPAPAAVPSLSADLLELAKPRITVMVLVTATVGYLLAVPADAAVGIAGLVGLVHALVGTALVAASGSVLNQVVEREHDARMRRTAARPLPTGRVGADLALGFGVALGVAGLAYLTFLVNPLTALLGALTLAGYVFVYTPMKRWSSLATVVGAAPGAMPPVMGWAAYADSLSLGAWVLFAILFFWQLPHFLAIAWMYKNDYGRAGYPLLPVIQPDGASTARQAVLWAAALVPLGLVPSALGLTGLVYALGAFVLGAVYFWASVVFARHPSAPTARRLLLTSVLYLPALLVVMLADRLLG
jgi:protoheme IX farnesyltransferase